MSSDEYELGKPVEVEHPARTGIRLGITLTAEQADRLQQLAEAKNQTMLEFLREHLLELLS